MHSRVRKGSHSRADALKFPKRSMFQDINITYEGFIAFLLQPYCHHRHLFFLSFILYISDNHIYIILFDAFLDNGNACAFFVHFRLYLHIINVKRRASYILWLIKHKTSLGKDLILFQKDLILF